MGLQPACVAWRRKKIHAGRVISTTGAQEFGGIDHAPFTTAHTRLKSTIRPHVERFVHSRLGREMGRGRGGQYSTLRGRHAWQQGSKTPVPDRAATRVAKKNARLCGATRQGARQCNGENTLIRSYVLLIFLYGSLPLLSLLNFAHHRVFTLHLQVVLCWLFNLILPCRTLLFPPLSSPSASPIEGPL